MNEVGLRRMTLADVPAVMNLENDLFTEDAWSQNILLGELSEPSRHYVVAETDGEVIGYAGLRSVPPHGDVQTMAVARDRWGTGVGRTLLTELLDEAARRGSTRVFLEVRDDNPRAQKLYADFGFERLGVRRGYYRDADAIVMRRVDPSEQEEDR